MDKRLDELAEQATDDFLHRSSITFLECAIHLMATHMSLEEVAHILEEEARLLRELG